MSRPKIRQLWAFARHNDFRELCLREQVSWDWFLLSFSLLTAYIPRCLAIVTLSLVNARLLRSLSAVPANMILSATVSFAAVRILLP